MCRVLHASFDWRVPIETRLQVPTKRFAHADAVLRAEVVDVLREVEPVLAALALQVGLEHAVGLDERLPLQLVQDQVLGPRAQVPNQQVHDLHVH